MDEKDSVGMARTWKRFWLFLRIVWRRGWGFERIGPRLAWKVSRIVHP